VAILYNTTQWIIKENNLRQQTYKAKNIWLLLPIFGTLIFVLLYFFATFFYPGGSQVDRNSIGFSWINNYWCNLLNETAINGQPNTAKPIALTGMFILCFTLPFFWFVFPTQINISKTLKLLIQVSGILAMTVAFFFIYTFKPQPNNKSCFIAWGISNNWNFYSTLQKQVVWAFCIWTFQCFTCTT
jgi:hypothetical protein